MGFVRVLLALAVVTTHLGIGFSVGGILAVQLFYMISGFLISYVIVERQSYPNVGNFYASRYLRLFPAYFVVAIASLVAVRVGNPGWFDKFSAMPASAIALLVFANCTLFLQDAVMFLGIKNQSLVPVVDFLNSDIPLFTGLLVPQAWSISLELMFYIIAPFLLPRFRLVVVLFAISLALRAVLIGAGIGLNDPWSYRFFPTELALFLLGALAHQKLLPWAQRFDSPRVRTTVFSITLVTLLAWSNLPFQAEAWRIALFASFAFALPFLFLFQNASRLDQRIGDLSYPIYINHMLTLHVCRFVAQRIGLEGSWIMVGVSVAASIVFAYMLDRAITTPVDRLRHRLRGGKSVFGAKPIEA